MIRYLQPYKYRCAKVTSFARKLINEAFSFQALPALEYQLEVFFLFSCTNITFLLIRTNVCLVSTSPLSDCQGAMSDIVSDASLTSLAIS